MEREAYINPAGACPSGSRSMPTMTLKILTFRKVPLMKTSEYRRTFYISNRHISWLTNNKQVFNVRMEQSAFL